MNKSHMKIINRIDEEIGTDLKNLCKSRKIVDYYKNEFGIIEGKLSLDNTWVTSDFKSSLIKAEKSCETVAVELEKIEQFRKHVSEKLIRYDIFLNAVTDKLNTITRLEWLTEYFKILDNIKEISNNLKTNLHGKDEQKIIGYYLALCDESNSSNSILGRLQHVNARNLNSYARKTAIYWYKVLREKFVKDLEYIFKAIKFPSLDTITEEFNPPKEQLQKLSTITEYLFLLKSPDDSDKQTHVNITATIVCPVITLPIEIILKPFRQRFLYHFTGSRLTNRLDKPEWYFSQILSWIKAYHKFISRTFQNAANLAGAENVNVRLEFIRGLVQLSIEKLSTDIDQIVQNEHLYGHLIDESLSFDQELKELYGYPSSYPNAATVLTQAQYLTKWLTIEKKSTTDQMDDMLRSGQQWNFIDPHNIEELRIPICADQFIRLLDAIKERYCGLSQPGHKLQFLSLQLELIDNFRRRLVQLHNSTVDNVSTTKILNALNYIISVLREWGESVHYLHLNATLVNLDSDDIHSVFDESINELEHWQNNLIKDLATKITDEIKAKSLSYRRDKWISMPKQVPNEPFMLTDTAGEMFQLMVNTLHKLEKELSSNILIVLLRLIGHKLDEFFIDSMIMNAKFSTGGAVQFQYDMTRNLFAVFGQYVKRSDLIFKKIHDACILLTLPLGPARLLYDTIQSNRNNEIECRNALKEIGINNMSHLLVPDILDRRKDLFGY